MTTLHYTRQGSGEPVVLIHGIGHHGPAWGEVTDLLAQTYDVVVVDLPGHGRSPAPTKPQSYAVDSVLDQLEGLFDDLDLGRPHVVGNSLGGYFALGLAGRGSVASVTALSPASFWNALELYAITGPQLLTMKFSTYSPEPVLKLFADREPLRKISMASLYVHPERLTPERALADSLNLRRSKGFWPFFVRAATRPLKRETPKVPVTIGWGDKDRLLIPKQARRAAEKLPTARVETLPGCGHVPMLDDPQAVVDLVRSTITAAAPTPAAVTA